MRHMDIFIFTASILSASYTYKSKNVYILVLVWKFMFGPSYRIYT